MQAAPLHVDVADGPPGGEAWWVMAEDVRRLRIATWPAAEDTRPAGTVLIFPGRTEYAEKYGRAARAYAQAGYAVAAIDWRGQGLSARTAPDPRLGHVENFAEFQRDVAALLGLIEARGLPGPRFLVAHSMGGCIGLRALIDGLPVRAVAFSAPMWGAQVAARDWPFAVISALFGPSLGLGGKLTPRTNLDHPFVEGGFPGNDLTTDREMWDFVKTQVERYPTLALGGPTLGWAHAALIETTRLARLPAPVIPALTFLGTNDRIVSPGAIRHRMARWPGGRLEIVADAEHEIVLERPEVRESFFTASIELFRRHG